LRAGHRGGLADNDRTRLVRRFQAQTMPFVIQASDPTAPTGEGSLAAEYLALCEGVLALEDLWEVNRAQVLGLRERAATVGGWIDLSSSARGTTLILSIPVSAARGGADGDAPGGARAEHHDEAAADTHDPSAWGTL
jgi:hypothetical protein